MDLLCLYITSDLEGEASAELPPLSLCQDAAKSDEMALTTWDCYATLIFSRSMPSFSPRISPMAHTNGLATPFSTSPVASRPHP